MFFKRIQKIIKRIDIVMLLSMLAIMAIGLVVLDSATVNASVKYQYNFVARQALWMGAGWGVFFLVLMVDYSILKKFAMWLYGLAIVLLGAVLAFGSASKGSSRWLILGPIRLQPSELVKLFLILSLSYYLSNRIGKLKTWREMLPAFFFVGLPLGLIMLQPDLGTGMVFVAIMFGMLLAAGASIPKLLFVLFGALGSAVAWIVGHYQLGWWIPLKEYQLMRLVVFVNPDMDPRNWGWNLIQSKITIGSGGLWGQGWGKGPQTMNEFLPEQWTDFIFCVFAEEFGFVGVLVLLLLLFVLLWRGLRIASQAKDTFGALAATGIVSMIAFHIFQNIGMTVGIMPITGLPLPLMSYGGSSMLVNMFALGMLMNIYVHREPIIL